MTQRERETMLGVVLGVLLGVAASAVAAFLFLRPRLRVRGEREE
jgi:ABC-type branched-subunit amino acid transport system permease subunit